MFIMVEFFLMVLSAPLLKVWGGRVYLDDGLCGATIPIMHNDDNERE